MVITTTADKTPTVQEFISMQSSDDVTYYNFSLLKHINGYDMFITNLLYDYEEDLMTYAKTVEFSDMEKIKYMYKPDILAYDVYGSTEAQFVIMMLNGIINPKDFNFKKIKMIPKGELSTLLGRIMSINDKYMKANKAQLKDDLKADKDNHIWSV